MGFISFLFVSLLFFFFVHGKKCQMTRKGMCMTDGGGLQNKLRKTGRGAWACTHLQKPGLVSLWVTRPAQVLAFALKLFFSRGVPLVKLSILFPFKAHFKTAVVLAQERTPGLTLRVPLQQLHLLAGVEHLQSDTEPIDSTLCPSGSQNQRLGG